MNNEYEVYLIYAFPVDAEGEIMPSKLSEEISQFESSQLELSIIVPCLDEEENIEPLLASLDDLRTQYNLANFETLVLDDSSSDRTFEKVAECFPKFTKLNIRAIRRYEPRRGYGAIVRFGIAHARGKYCVPVSADGVDPIELIPVFLEKVRSGADLVQCSRYLNLGDDDTIPIKYKFCQTGWRFLIRMLMGQNIRDSTYAFKIFRRTDVLALGLTTNGFSISPEIFFKVLLSGGRVEHVPSGQGVRQRGKSHFIFRREGVGFVCVLLRAWLHRLGILWF
ncbi:glycosyltransferase family 2 protein [Patescibacteria group bacterium]|nr:glycosyltransferase family 2 protein [Patescibacteria group bacterium]